MKLETEFKETELGMIPSDWEIKELTELAINYDYKRIPLSKMERTNKKGKFPYYGASGIIDYIDEYIFEGDYLLISEDGENLRSRNTPIAFLVNDKFWVNNHSHIIKSDKNHINLFLLYYFQLLDVTPYLTGSVQPKLSQSNLNKIKIPLPFNENEQKAIAKILSDLDEKIEINRKINENLEELGQTLFKRWFIDFEFPNEKGEPYKSSGGEMIESELGEIPKGWKVDKLGNYVNSINGYSYKSVELQPSNDALVTLKNFDRTGGFRYDGFKEIKGTYKEIQKVIAGDLVVAHTDLTTNAEVLGNPVIIPKSKYDNMVISMDLVKVIPKSKTLTIPFLYFLMRNYLFKGHCLGYSNGTTVLHLKKTAIPEFEFVIPNKEIVDKYSKLSSNIIGQIIDLTEELQSLQQIRDSLLPKLMSGQIRVK